jgi:hypothetical protein
MKIFYSHSIHRFHNIYANSIIRWRVDDLAWGIVTLHFLFLVTGSFIAGGHGLHCHLSFCYFYVRLSYQDPTDDYFHDEYTIYYGSTLYLSSFSTIYPSLLAYVRELT